MPYVVGLTGGIGSGKSTVANLFRELGADVIDTDEIAHALTAARGAAMDAIRTAFGAQYVTPEGALDRGRMRQLVFSDRDARRRLEAILHPMIRDQTAARTRASSAPYVVLVVPLLLESGAYQSTVDRVAVVDCDEAAQIERTRLRSGLRDDEVRAIIASQIPRKERLARANDVVRNDGAPDELRPQVERLHRAYLSAARDASPGGHARR